ncbi:GNAT family N-acetyltransferase [Bacillus sp. NEB1478]|uniref:GNAT family N-acetyltransferase n=1 Tax=Bacillus sp. NEB1478 TaxID=3073816 RepID=UPI002873B7CD|nr:GNAT family N-acetyltransferase [Bacillus sp. NEB1478]WNB93883.1 GNAT family N-acetyltransferase [Bacillus sp. NEB1478]
MKTELITDSTKKDFLLFCKKHRNHLDDSYLSDKELELFCPEKEAAYVIRDSDNLIIGAVSLILDHDYIITKKARFRIFFCEKSEQKIYQHLLDKIMNNLQAGDYIYAFVKEEHIKLHESYKIIGFEIERYVFVLERDDLTLLPPIFPEDYSLKTFRFGRDESIFCKVRNEGFKQLIGFTPMSPKTAAQMQNWDDYLEDGIFLLYHKCEPIGVVRTGKDFFNGSHYATVNTLAIIPKYQGKGLGRQLLRTCLAYGKEKGLEKGFLCVNADNDQAAKLYEQEGFQKTESFVCYNFIKN